MATNQQTNWEARSFPVIHSYSVSAGVPEKLPVWETTVNQGNSMGCLVDDKNYYHNAGGRQIAYSLLDGKILWDEESSKHESTGSSRIVLGELLVNAPSTLIRDKNSGKILADLKESLGCPENSFGFGSFSFCYEWNKNILFYLQKPSYTYQLVNGLDFSVIEMDVNPGHLILENENYAVFMSQTEPDMIEIYNKSEMRLVARLKDDCFNFQQNQSKFCFSGSTLIAGVKSARVFKAWNVENGNLYWESSCAFPADSILDEHIIDNKLDGMVPYHEGFLLFRHFPRGVEKSLVNQVWYVSADSGNTFLCAEAGGEFQTRSGINAGEIFFLERKNENGTFSPCAIDSVTAEILWQPEHQSRLGYDILLSNRHVVYVESTPEPCTVLCYSWDQSYSPERDATLPDENTT